MKSFISLLISCFFASSLMAADIKSPKSDLFIKVEKDQDLRRFSLCSQSKGPASCQFLGFKQWYSLEELNAQRSIEQLQVGASALGVGALAYTGAVAGWLIVGGVAEATAGALSAAIANGGAISFAGATFIGSEVLKVGPVEQFKQQHILRDEVANDEDVLLKSANDKKMKEVAKVLRTVLEKLDD